MLRVTGFLIFVGQVFLHCEKLRQSAQYNFLRNIQRRRTALLVSNRIAGRSTDSYRNSSWRYNRYWPSFPSKFDAPMYMTFPAAVAAMMPAFIASLTEDSSMPFRTIS